MKDCEIDQEASEKIETLLNEFKSKTSEIYSSWRDAQKEYICYLSEVQRIELYRRLREMNGLVAASAGVLFQLRIKRMLFPKEIAQLKKETLVWLGISLPIFLVGGLFLASSQKAGLLYVGGALIFFLLFLSYGIKRLILTTSYLSKRTVLDGLAAELIGQAEAEGVGNDELSWRATDYLRGCYLGIEPEERDSLFGVWGKLDSEWKIYYDIKFEVHVLYSLRKCRVKSLFEDDFPPPSDYWERIERERRPQREVDRLLDVLVDTREKLSALEPVRMPEVEGERFSL